MNAISIRNVTKKFGDFIALKDISFEVPEGKIFGLLGPNGAGKTTLIRIINHIILPTEGEVVCEGKIGYLPEERGLYKKMKVGEQAIYLARLQGLSHDEAIRRLKKWFQKFGIQPWWNKKVDELSKGMAQKVQFIITVLCEPKILILDEPFSGFDPINVELIKNEILRLKNEGCTIILSTHNMASVEELCDSIALFNKSRLILSGGVDEIRKKYSPNAVEVSHTEPITACSGLFTIAFSEGEKAKGYRSVLHLEAGLTNKAVLQQLLEQTEITAYQPVMTKMSDIFIKLVNETGGATSQSINDKKEEIK